MLQSSLMSIENPIQPSREEQEELSFLLEEEACNGPEPFDARPPSIRNYPVPQPGFEYQE